MSRTGRLFLLLEALRAHRRPVTAATLAERLGVSERTIYRDIHTLVGLGAPIAGEAGLGYVLRAGMFLPPLMFCADELEALVLGARWVEQQGDAELALAASSALAKIATASPRDLRDIMAHTSTSLLVPAIPNAIQSDAFIGPARAAIRNEQRLRIDYRDGEGRATQRLVWPCAIGFFEGRRVLAAWCELRAGFRHFRIDRIQALEATGQRYPERRAALLKKWRLELGLLDPTDRI
jgi:predicted DNA-binding transcriptional regulator YafY